MLIPKQIAGMTKAVSQDGTRPALNCINFKRQDGKAMAEVCDGKIALRSTWDEIAHEELPSDWGNAEPQKDFTALVEANDFSKAVKAMPRKAYLPIFQNLLLKEGKTQENGHVYLLAGDHTATTEIAGQKCDMPFVDLNEVIPDPIKTPIAFEVGMGVDTWLKALTSIKAMYGDRVSVRATFYTALAPCRIEVNTGSDIKTIGVIMPTRL